MTDTREVITHPRLVIDLTDSVSLPFTAEDLEWMGEVIEEALNKRFAVQVSCIVLEQR